MTLLWAFEQSRHAEIKTIQELSTVTSRAVDFKCQKMSNQRTRAAPQIRRLVAGFSLRKTGFDPGEVQVGSAVRKLTIVQFFSRYFGILLSNIIPAMIRIRLSSGGWTSGPRQSPPSHEQNHAEARCTILWLQQRADYHKLKPRTPYQKQCSTNMQKQRE
jgi:hypothetical protein